LLSEAQVSGGRVAEVELVWAQGLGDREVELVWVQGPEDQVAEVEPVWAQDPADRVAGVPEVSGQGRVDQVAHQAGASKAQARGPELATMAARGLFREW